MQNRAIRQILEMVSSYLHATIDVSNRPNAKKQNDFFSPLVYMCQKKCDEILGNANSSVLENILRCAKEVEQYKAGNCMLQTFLALDYILKSFAIVGLITPECCLPVSICTNRVHAFICVKDYYVCDSWKGNVTTMNDYSHQNVKEYFGMRYNWLCFSDANVDKYSTEYTYKLIDDLIKNNPENDFFKRNMYQLLELKKQLSSCSLTTSSEDMPYNSVAKVL